MNDPNINITPTLESDQEQFDSWRIVRTRRNRLLRPYGKRNDSIGIVIPRGLAGMTTKYCQGGFLKWRSITNGEV